MQDIAVWLESDDEYADASTVISVVEIDVVRIFRQLYPLTRMQKVRFKVVRSARMAAVLGRDILDELDRQDYDSPDPLQTDIDYDERTDIDNLLEAAFDRGVLAGLPKLYVAKYRELVFREYYRVFRLRLGKDTPAHFKPMRVHTIPGLTMRQGYKIKFNNLAPEALQQLKKQLQLNKAMGVISDDVPTGAVLHSLLTVKKPGGGLRWVVTCVTANDVTVAFYHYAVDNAERLQQVMRGAKFYWLADLTKGYWQIALAPESQWMFCFATPWGAYKYLRAPMGSKATGPYFDKCMAAMLEGADLLHKGVVMVHDDHAGYSDVIYDDDPNGRSHFHLLRRYLKACAEMNVVISPKKFEVFQTAVDIAGFLHSNGGPAALSTTVSSHC